MTVAAINRALATVIDPELRLPLTELDMIGEVLLADGSAVVEVKLTVVGCPASAKIERETREAVLSVEGVTEVDVRLGSAETRRHRPLEPFRLGHPLVWAARPIRAGARSRRDARSCRTKAQAGRRGAGS
mgnify:CR=1 FL=1